MDWHQLPLGPLQTNCYIISNEDNTCLIIDPGEEPDKIFAFVDGKNLKPVAIMLTHAHFDHIGAVDEVREKYSVPVYVHQNEADWLSDPALNGSQYFMGNLIRVKKADFLFTDEKEMSVEGFIFTVYETPGHSPGSVSLYFAEEDFVAGGDALFQGSIGRTDLPWGNQDDLLRSIHEKLLALPEETVVLPGHGPVTTIGREMDTNPFLNGF
ncbi:MBL fold metallo-hydrolase [Bacillus sp. T33-2]|uniref:MBL fold metallo-hydrolase n=1 Tax=Bacillus sp. T33-2 TaxID=2054168 RepID=UPI000C760DD0|nr:MBL fold metallo-hydrolase [Bacillus sp. T33-2]PLR89501.1 hypothetical protein CVD19_23775 [Bacillus sp. T33-2]